MRRSFRPSRQADFWKTGAAVFDASDGPQTVEVAPGTVVSRDVLAAWDIDPKVSDRIGEHDHRLLAPPEFRNPPLLCSRVPEGAVATSAGIVLTAERHWLVDSVAKPHFASRVIRTDRKLRIRVDVPKRTRPESVAVVFAQFRKTKTKNYWHWLTEGLTRTAMLTQSGAPQDIGILVPTPVLPLHSESLAAIGVDPERIIPWDGEPARFAAVYLPSPTMDRGMEPSATAISFIRGSVARSGGSPARRLWVSRRMAKRSRVSNDAELSSAAANLGFDEVLAERLSVTEQVELFAGAEAIAGVHGAGLANAIFMAEGTKVAEAAPEGLESRWKLSYWNLAAAARQAYAFCVGAGDTVDPERLERVLSELVGEDAKAEASSHNPFE